MSSVFTLLLEREDGGEIVAPVTISDGNLIGLAASIWDNRDDDVAELAGICNPTQLLAGFVAVLLASLSQNASEVDDDGRRQRLQLLKFVSPDGQSMKSNRAIFVREPKTTSRQSAVSSCNCQLIPDDLGKPCMPTRSM